MPRFDSNNVNYDTLGVSQNANTTAPAALGQTAATLGYAEGIEGKVTSGSPGAFSAAVRGINNGTGGSQL